MSIIDSSTEKIYQGYSFGVKKKTVARTILAKARVIIFTMVGTTLFRGHFRFRHIVRELCFITSHYSSQKIVFRLIESIQESLAHYLSDRRGTNRELFERSGAP